MQREFCYICGNKITPVRKNAWYCGNCGQDYYSNPRATIDIALFNEKGEVLLCERAADPSRGKFDLPGGFVDAGENLEEALSRELSEELDLENNDYTTPKYCLSYSNVYPWGKETYELVCMMYTAKLKKIDKIRPKDDVTSVKFVHPSKLKLDELSYNRLPELIKQALNVKYEHA